MRNRPVIVGPGVVLAASYEARACGVRSAMGAAVARRLCPQALVVEPRWSAYLEASRTTFEVFEQAAPQVEKLSIDEAFLDVRGLERIAGTPAEIAGRLRGDVREQVGLPISVGVACTRIVAKMASGEAKPDGLLVVPAGGELAFLHPLRVERIWGVGAATAARLHDRGITTIGHIAQVPEPALMSILGRAAGRRLHALGAQPFKPPVPAFAAVFSLAIRVCATASVGTVPPRKGVLWGTNCRECPRLTCGAFRPNQLARCSLHGGTLPPAAVDAGPLAASKAITSRLVGDAIGPRREPSRATSVPARLLCDRHRHRRRFEASALASLTVLFLSCRGPRDHQPGEPRSFLVGGKLET